MACKFPDWSPQSLVNYYESLSTLPKEVELFDTTIDLELLKKLLTDENMKTAWKSIERWKPLIYKQTDELDIYWEIYFELLKSKNHALDNDSRTSEFSLQTKREIEERFNKISELTIELNKELDNLYFDYKHYFNFSIFNFYLENEFRKLCKKYNFESSLLTPTLVIKDNKIVIPDMTPSDEILKFTGDVSLPDILKALRAKAETLIETDIELEKMPNKTKNIEEVRLIILLNKYFLSKFKRPLNSTVAKFASVILDKTIDERKVRTYRNKYQ